MKRTACLPALLLSLLALAVFQPHCGGGRVYAVTYTATDGNGNQAAATADVVVPSSHAGTVDPVSIRLSGSPLGTVVSWNEVASALSYDVIRGDLAGVTETDTLIDLGSVRCPANDSLDSDTLGAEDPELPQQGGVFCYLVEHCDGVHSSYGTESVNLPRVPGPRACGHD